MQDFPEVSWLERYRERVNADPELAVIGGWFSTSLSLTFGERRYVVRMERASPSGESPEAFAQFLQRDRVLYEKLKNEAKLKID